MAKRKVTFDDYNEQTWEEYTGEEPPPNRWYTVRADRGKYDEQEDQMLFYCVITEGDFAGWSRAWYAPFEGNQKWKLQEFIRAVTGKKQAVELDWENEKVLENWLKKGRSFRMRLEEYNGQNGPRLSIRKVAPLMVDASASTTAPAPAPAPAPEPDVADDEALEDYTEDELNAITDAEELESILLDEFKVPEDELPVLPARSARSDKDGSKYRALLVKTILEEQEAEGDEGSDGEDGTDDGEGDFADGFDDDNGTEPEPDPEPDPEPAPARRTRAAKAAPAKAAAPAATTTRRRRG